MLLIVNDYLNDIIYDIWKKFYKINFLFYSDNKLDIMIQGQIKKSLLSPFIKIIIIELLNL